MAKTKIKEGQTYHIDTCRVSQYIGERIVDDVEVAETPKRTDKRVLVYSPSLMANVLIPKSELKTI
ncbi:MAG: hypothetical protein Q8O88_03915 [bacterium]|nr:hypothetical protein [bacterium]